MQNQEQNNKNNNKLYTYEYVFTAYDTEDNAKIASTCNLKNYMKFYTDIPQFFEDLDKKIEEDILIHSCYKRYISEIDLNKYFEPKIIKKGVFENEEI